MSSLQSNLSPLVMSFVSPRRSHYSEVHLCAHFRLGNNEKGDWERKEWRHVDEEGVLVQTLEAMEGWAQGRGGGGVSVFVPSDKDTVAP